MADRDLGGHLPRAGAGRGRGPPLRAAHPRDPRPVRLRGPGVPLRALGRGRGPRGQARRRRRDGRLGGPDRAGAGRAGRRARGLPAHAVVGGAARRPRLHRAGAARLRPRPGRGARAARGALRRGRAGDRRAPAGAPGHRPAPRPRPRPPRRPGAGRGPPRAPDPRLRDRVQAHRHLRRPLPGAAPRRRHPGAQRARPRREVDGDRGVRRPPPRRRPRPRHRLLDDAAAVRAAHRGARTACSRSGGPTG